MIDRLLEALSQIRLLDIVDIAIVYYVFYRILLMIRDTRAVQLIKGLLVLLGATLISDWLELSTLNWLLNQLITAGVVAVPIIFWPELRRALEQLGRARFLGQKFSFAPEEEGWEETIEQLGRTVSILGKNQIGGLMVLERDTGLAEYVETGTRLDALVSSELLTNTFIPNTPLHDGAAIIRRSRILAAGCYLPLSSNPEIDRELGTRHRAGIGITEETDAIAIIVWEETGIISLAEDGQIIRQLDAKSLQEKLRDLLPERTAPVWEWRMPKHERQ